MANEHFGRIGDIWKHLPLAQILSIERPSRYWESHAGSAQYPLTHSPERDYGIFHLLQHADESGDLRSSAYWRLLDGLRVKDSLPYYPGSPMIAMLLLQPDQVDYCFCDLDGESLTNILEHARRLGIRDSDINCVKDDGVPALFHAAEGLSTENAAHTFTHIDPYEPFDESGSGCPAPVDLFCGLSGRGLKTMLWYGFDSHEHRALCHDRIRRSLADANLDPASIGLWCGEIVLSIINEPNCQFDPGVRGGCGILTANLSAEAVSACLQLGKGLEPAYETTTLPTGHSGAVRFTTVSV
jgi:23S rRNA (adenine2030-N6)-methyltransferase